MATHSSVLAWRIPWNVYPMGWRRGRQNGVTFTSLWLFLGEVLKGALLFAFVIFYLECAETWNKTVLVLSCTMMLEYYLFSYHADKVLKLLGNTFNSWTKIGIDYKITMES